MDTYKNKMVLVTGASSGIGKAMAIDLAAAGAELILTARSQDLLEALANEIHKNGGQAHVFSVDLSEAGSAETLHTQITEANLHVDILVNNAGLAARLSSIEEGSLDDWERMIDTNVKGLLYVSKVIIPQMTERQSGHIINIGSSAGKEVYPKGNVYCASKHAVLAITEGMRIDLNPFGIKVGAVNPGLVETEFSQVRFKGDKIADTVYKGFKALQAQDIADIIYFVISRPYHVNIADLLVFPTAQANSTTVKKS